MEAGLGGRVPLDRIMLPGISHVCLVVEDLRRSAEEMSERFGVGPFETRVITTPQTRGIYRGRPSAYEVYFAYCKSGSLVLELAQPLEGESHLKEFLEERGPGLHHLGYPVGSELEAELGRWRRSGIEPLQVHYREDPRYGWAYMDTEALVGCILEVVCDPPLGWWDYSKVREELPDRPRATETGH